MKKLSELDPRGPFREDKIYAFNSYKEVFKLCRVPGNGGYNFFGLYCTNQYWLPESMTVMKECLEMMSMFKTILMFDNQLEFVEWASRVSKDGKTL